MSMTWEEAIKWLEETIQDTDTYWESCSEALQKELDEQKEVFLLALTALRHNVSAKAENKPLTQADLDSLDYDKVWLDYGDDGEWALAVHGRIYSLANLEGCGFEDILRDEVAGETMERPSGDYTVYRRPPEGEESNDDKS